MTFIESLGPPTLEYQVYVRGFPESRYRTVEPFVREAFDSFKYWPHEERVCIADIGGFRNNIIAEKVFHDLPTIALNIPSEYHFPKRYGDVTYDGLNMPLASDSIPVVMSVDVLEQVHPDNRLRLIEEMVRVAQERVVIACPFYSAENVGAELNLLDRMRKAGLPEKTSIKIHRQNELPKLGELVDMGRKMAFPFQLWPATNSRLDFHHLNAQVDVLRATNRDIELAKALAKAADASLSNIENVQRPTWNEAYRAVLIIDKYSHGRVLSQDSDYIYSNTETTAYGRALGLAWFGNIRDPVNYVWNPEYPGTTAKEIPLRGFNIAFEGPDGVGKTETIQRVAEKLAKWGYTVATPMRYGPRQKLREWEKTNGVLPEPSREALLVDTTNQSIIAGNAHKLLGSCCIALSDRTLTGTLVYHEIHGIQRPVEYVLQNTYTIPPDLTIILEVDDFEENWKRKGAKGDPANAQITKEQLEKQRRLYKEMKENKFTGPIIRVKSNGTVEETSEAVLDAIEKYFGISTRRDITSQDEV